MDQASIRIIVQDEGTINPSNAQSPSQSAPNPNPYASQPANQYAATPSPRVAGPTPAQLPTQRFDPVAEASKMREAEIRREMVKATYDRLYDTADKTKSALDAMLDVALKMRGTLGGAFGGAFGGLVGPALDLYALYKDRQKSSVRIEAERRLGFASGGEIPPYPGVPTNADEVPVKATAGEFIVNKAAAQVPENRAILEEMNSGPAPAFYDEGDPVYDAISVPDDEDAPVDKRGVGEDIARFQKVVQDAFGTDAAKFSEGYAGNAKVMIGDRLVNLSLGSDGMIHSSFKFSEDAKIDDLSSKYTVENHAFGVAAKSLRSGSIDFAHAMKDFVGHAGKEGFGIEYAATDKRNKIYGKLLSRAGFEENKSEHSSVSQWMPKHYATGGPVDGSSVASGPPPVRPYRGGSPPDVSEKVYPSIYKQNSGSADALMAVAPEIGIFVKALQAVESQIHSTISGAASLLSTAVGPDANSSKSVMDLGDAVKSTFGGLIGIVGETTSSFGKLMGTIDGVANRYAEFSPEIAQAQGFAEIRQTMGDLRRAQEAGPELARYVQMQSEMQQKFEDIKIKILLKILPLIETFATLLETAVETGSGIAPAILTAAAPLTAIVTALNAWVRITEDINNPPADDPTNLLINLTNGSAGPGLTLPPPT